MQSAAQTAYTPNVNNVGLPINAGTESGRDFAASRILTSRRIQAATSSCPCRFDGRAMPAAAVPFLRPDSLFLSHRNFSCSITLPGRHMDCFKKVPRTNCLGAPASRRPVVMPCRASSALRRVRWLSTAFGDDEDVASARMLPVPISRTDQLRFRNFEGIGSLRLHVRHGQTPRLREGDLRRSSRVQRHKPVSGSTTLKFLPIYR